MAIAHIVSRGRIFYGWYIVAVAAIAGASAGVLGYSFGLFFDPMRESLGWSRTSISWAIAIRSAINMLTGPIYGPIVDRKHGALILMAGGGVVLGISMMLTAAMTELWQFYLLIGVAYGLAMGAEGSQVVAPVVISKWFIRKRGRALAIVTLGPNVGNIIFIPLAAFIILNFGWREAWFISGLFALLMVSPLSALFVRRTPEDIGLRPDGDTHDQASERATDTQRSDLVTDYDWTLREAVRTPGLWMMVAAFTVSGAGLGGFLVHVLPALTDKGYSTAFATAMVAELSVVVLVAKMVWGFLGERIQVRYLMMVSFVLSAMGLFLVVVVDRGNLILLLPLVYGIGGAGYGPLSSLMWANYFGRRSLGSIRGALLPITQVVSAFSPVFAGAVFESEGSYDLAFIIFGLCFVFAAGAIYVARRPEPPKPV
ncbi:MAG: MFS transporter [Chloroflexi bacterium]|nr:MFS transporter [Chloroflexota bacterium]